MSSSYAKDFTISRPSFLEVSHIESYLEGISEISNTRGSSYLQKPVIQSYSGDPGLPEEVVLAVEHERFRLAHELHDGVGQILTGAVMLTEALRADLTGTAQEDADRILELVRKAAVQVRTLSHLTSPEFVKSKDLTQLLTVEVAYWESFHAIEYHLETNLRICDEALISQLFRITQEAVHNAIRHGRAKLIQIKVYQADATHGALEIINDGAPLSATPANQSGGIGLRGMKHRAELIHASLDIQNIFTGGVSVNCRFPLHSHPSVKHPQPSTP